MLAPANSAKANTRRMRSRGTWKGPALGEQDRPGRPYTYRVQGPPPYRIEFLNVQSDSAGNPANHIHSAWRSLKNDFGLAAK